MCLLGVNRSAYFPLSLFPVTVLIIFATAANVRAIICQGFMLSTSFYVNMTVIQEARASAFLQYKQASPAVLHYTIFLNA